MRISFYYLRYYILLVAGIVLSVTSRGQSGKYPILNFSPSDYQAGIQNIGFAQNRDMNLFVANNLGILSYNGDVWSQHAMNTGKKQRSLAFDETSNRLYVGSQGDFGYFDGNFNYVSLSDLMPQGSRGFDEVWNVFILNSKVYFCTFQGIFIYNGEDIEVIDRDGGFNRSFVAGKRLFTQTPAGELLELESGELKKTIYQNRSNDIVAGVIAKDEGYFVFYNSGRIEFSTSLSAQPVFPELAAALDGTFVNYVAELSDSRLVVTTQRAGIFLFDFQTETIDNLTVEDGLLTNACLNSFQDFSGNLWVGMQNGIAVIYINSPARLINNEINLQGSGYEAYEIPEGTYYTTSNGIYFLKEGTSESVFMSGTEGPAYGMQMIDNTLYACHHTGLFMLKDGKALRIATTDGLWQIKQLRSNPDFVLGGTYSGLYLFRLEDGGILKPIQRINGFSETSRFFEEDANGNIWVGQFYKGLYRLSLNSDLTSADVTAVSDSVSSLPLKEHIFLSRIDDEIYIGTEEGIFRLDDSQQRIVKAENFSDVTDENWIYFLTQDAQKNVHVYSENSLGFFKHVSKNNYVYVPSSMYYFRHSFNNDLLNVSRNVSNGVFFNANEGFVHYDPEAENRLSFEQKPLVSRVLSIAEDSVLFRRSPFEARPTKIDTLAIIEGTRVLQFSVESFNYKGGGENRFRYFLEGFDPGYGEWTNSTLKEYNNLKEGSYRFFVQTVSHTGEFIESDAMVINVIPPFYKTIWAKIFYALICLGVLVYLYRWQRYRYKVKEMKLVNVRNEELERKQGELKELKEEQVKSELRHVNNLLAASTMNLVVKNEFIENIKDEIMAIKSKENVPETRKGLDRIIREIETTLKVQEDWKQFEHHFDRVHGDFLTRLTNEYTDLTPGEQKLCAFLRLKMDTKEIANLMGVSLRGVEVARYRLRKKLNLESHQNLSKFILEY